MQIELINKAPKWAFHSCALCLACTLCLVPCAFLVILAPMTERILILDFGSQYTQLIARAVREANVYCEILPFNKKIQHDASIKGVILSGSPFSVNDPNAPEVAVADLIQQTPVLGVCYGAQLTAKQFGGRVE